MSCKVVSLLIVCSTISAYQVQKHHTTMLIITDCAHARCSASNKSFPSTKPPTLNAQISLHQHSTLTIHLSDSILSRADMQVAPVHRDAGAAGLDYASLQPLPKPRTFRLSSIPVGVPRDQLLVALETLSALSGIEDGTRPPSVKVLSLARKSRNWQVGTVSFVREPAPFTRCLPNDKIELPITIAGNEFDMTIDVDFYGMVLASAESLYMVQ